MAVSFPKLTEFRGARDLAARIGEIGAEVPVDDEVSPAGGSPLAAVATVGGRRVGNRFCAQPMEGWDGTPDGRPSELTLRRWERIGSGGAKLIWGCEAVAVLPAGRANPHQLCLTAATQPDIEAALRRLRGAHAEAHETSDDMLVGLQLTHSGRYCRPHRHDVLEPRIAYHHPLLDRRVGVEPGDDTAVCTDTELDELLGDFARAAYRARETGFDFVDVKHCHGYLGHELLSAFNRPGPYGGDLRGRTRWLREAVAAVRREAPGLLVGVRLSAFDMVPFRPGADGTGVPEPHDGLLPYSYGFGVDADDPTRPDLREALEVAAMLPDMGVALCNVTAGSPYYTPHIQRPAQSPPSDGYLPPEDPLAGVLRQIQSTRDVKRRVGETLAIVGTGYSYLQEHVGNVAQAVVRAGWADFIGLGRMLLPYPDLPADLLAGRRPDRLRLCRTFSDCTTGPRLGMVSGCYPLDPFYRGTEDWKRLQAAKRAAALAAAAGHSRGAGGATAGR